MELLRIYLPLESEANGGKPIFKLFVYYLTTYYPSAEDPRRCL